MLNLILVFFIISSFVCYFYFKTKQFRTRQMHPIRKKMFASMAGVALGTLLFFFGLNQVILFSQVVIYIVSAIFILLGAYVAIFNFRAFKHYAQFVEEEAELNKH